MPEPDISKIYQKVLDAQVRHTKYLTATEKNLSYFYFGKLVSMVKQNVFPEMDVLSALSSYSPEPYNPLSYLVSAFMDEIANSELRTNVRPWPVAGKEPYESFSDYLEDYIAEIHRISNRKSFLRAIVFELLCHGYFGIYTDGFRYWFLSSYELIPGDPLIPNKEDQPFWIRKTKARKATLAKIPGIDLTKEQIPELDIAGDLDNIGLYDVWSKELDFNICLTEGGQKVYSQNFPYPKVYPIFTGVDTELLNSFYTIPLMHKLCKLLEKFQDSVSSTEESGKSIAKPLLVYDADAGIDINMVQRALKEGYKHIIIGKNREGDIGFRAPGSLPGYAVTMPDRIVDEMMKHLGLTQMFLGTPMAGVRERGALTRLIKASFRKLASKAALIEQAFSDLDMYLIEYLRAHQLKASNKFNLKSVEEIFTDSKITYIPQESIAGFSSEDTYENKMLTLSKWRTKLISQEQALGELGHHQPKKLIAQAREEVKAGQEFATKLRAEIETARPKSLLDQVASRLRSDPAIKFYLSPLRDDKVLVRCSAENAKRVAFLLSDVSNQVLIEPWQKKLVPPKPVEPVKEETPPPTAPPTPEIKGTPVVPSEETRGRPSLKLPKLPVKVEEPEKTEVPAHASPAIKPKFSEEELRDLIRLSKTIRMGDVKNYLAYPGIYIQEPHAEWIFLGKKILLVKSKDFSEEVLDQPHLLCGLNRVYGVLIVRKIVEDFDFEGLKKYHLVTSRERKKWWRDHKLYLYMFEFHPFEKPLEYEREPGAQTFIREVKIKPESIGVPFRGDIKPMTLVPFKIPPPHKPEKKAFQPHEVFTLERLREIIPEGSYDVSFKVDGLRAFLWIAEGKAQMFSDVGAKWPPERIEPILQEGLKKFKHDVLLDGELVMKGIERKDIAGYVHGEWKPTPEQLASLRYICWDTLFIKDKSIASLPFSKRSAILDLYVPYKRYQTGLIQRVAHGIAKDRDQVISLSRKLMSNEGVVIRDLNASYWATHSTYKMKQMFDVDAKVIAVEKTKIGLPIYHCVLRDGTYIGQTYAQSEVRAKPGDVIRVNIQHISTRPDGSIGWYAPRPMSWKQKITPKKTSVTQVGIGGPDSLDLIKEVYIVTVGSEEEWNAWLPKHEQWKKEVMPKLILRLKAKVKAGVPAAKT